MYTRAAHNMCAYVRVCEEFNDGSIFPDIFVRKYMAGSLNGDDFACATQISIRTNGTARGIEGFFFRRSCNALRFAMLVSAPE